MNALTERNLRLAALCDPEAYKKAFEDEPEKQFILDAVEHLTDTAIKCEDEVVEFPIWLATAAVLGLKGLVKRRSGRPYSVREQRRRMLRQLAKRRNPEPDPVVVEARALAVKLKADAKRKHEVVTAAKATEDAAKQTHDKYMPRYSWQTLAHRMKRPGRYAQR